MESSPAISACWPISRETLDVVMKLEAHPHHGPEDTGRSEFVWIRTSDGDLILGSFPYGDDYFAIEGLVEADWDAAIANGTVVQ